MRPCDGYPRRVSNSLDPREALLEVAEKLFAEHGPDGASLRDIARAAGQRNNSAVHYHFGGRDGLVAEVFHRRMTPINGVRSVRLAEADAVGESGELGRLVEILLLPLAEHVRAGGSGSTYAQFMVRTMATVDFAAEPFVEANEVQRELGRRMRTLVPHLGDSAFERRVRLAMTMAVSALADFELRWNRGLVEATELEPTMAEIIRMTTAALQAPGSG